VILLNNLGALSYIFTGNTGNTGNTGSILLNLLGTGFKNWERLGTLGTDWEQIIDTNFYYCSQAVPTFS